MSDISVFQYIDKILSDSYIESKIRQKEIFGITAKEIAEQFNQYRSNVSALLNKSVKDGTFIKIESRPVLFVPVELLKRMFHFIPNKDSYTQEEFLVIIYDIEQKDEEPFEPFIGYNGSQSTQVKQAQSAILYPPHGLHTLITGESGTGKTLFARTMYAFGKNTKNKKQTEYPFVEFNCADYFHNPQLLLSQLFGHIKGAFTGAVQESVGLVEKANGGILFLDEIHRLPPEGQELLFYLMDTGQYRKLGEANSIRKANVLIIGATTENPDDVLLRTFKRRIPLSIQLPAYRERPLKERLQIIEQMFLKEAIVTQRTYLVDSNIVKALSTFDFPGNIGQLASEIKILCARSFLENSIQESTEIDIPYKFLPKYFKDSYEKDKTKHEIFNDDLLNYNFDMVISPTNPIKYQTDKILDEQSYQNLIIEINNYMDQGISGKELVDKTNPIITEYYNDVLDRMYFKEINKEEIYKIIDQDIVDFSVELMKNIHDDLKLEITQQHILVLAFHIKFLIDRVNKESRSVQNEIHIEAEEPLVEKIITKLESKFNVKIPANEREFFHLLLKNMADENTSVRPELYILAHGTTATSIAEVCNRLMNTNYVKAINAPLAQDIQETYKIFLNEVKKSSPRNGIMILADMGSLLKFGERITEDTNITTHTIPNVSTAIALDFTHIMLNRNEHVDLIYNEYLVKNKNVEIVDTPANKKPMIISSCSSGKGTSVAFQSTITKLLEKHGLNHIVVEAVCNSDIQNNRKKYQELDSEYQILAIVGNIHLNIDKPFFHISALVSEEKEEDFINFIKNTTNVLQPMKRDCPSIQDEVVHFLEKHVMYVNPVAVAKVCGKFIDNIFKNSCFSTKNDRNLKTSLMIHLGFMIERIIVDKRIQYDNKDEFIKENQNLYDIIKDEIILIENGFDIKIHDDELCYIMVTLKEATQ